MPTILLTGATGFVGSHLVVALCAAGYEVRCATRSPTQARLRSPALTWVEFDVLRPASIEPALAGCDAAVFLVHSMGPGHDDAYPEHERAGAAAFAAAAGRAGLRRIVYLGGVVPAVGASRHLLSRQRTGETLRAGPVETIELRAAMVIGAGSASWVMVRDLARRLPAMVLPRWLRNTSFPIAIEDVVFGLVAALALPAGKSRIYELPGRERLSHREVLIRAAAAMGRRRFMISVPILTPRLSSYWIALVTRTSLAMAKELVEGVRSNLEPLGESLWAVVAHQPMPIDEAIRRALVDETSDVLPSIAMRARLAIP
ncbi:MAG: NAD(P)H-binding protein [Proteobacteria bacterium]|nr:NAD(P)H-binding protein [Pseudomonadota bacterium]